MTTKKNNANSPKNQSATTYQTSLCDRLNALLHTMRCIRQYEDALCEFSHESKGKMSLPAAMRGELSAILEKIPSHDYIDDLEMLKDMLASPRPSKASVKTARSTTARKVSAVSKNKSGRKLSK